MSKRMDKLKRVAAVFVGLAMLLGTVAQSMAAEVRGVRLWRAPDNTRLVFDLSGPVTHNVFTLTAPDRLVIDIPAGQMSATLDQLSLDNTPIKGIRSALRTPTELRIVVDLAARITPRSFSLPPNQQYGHRLVVDLYDEGASPEAPAASASAAAVPPVRTAPSPSAKRDDIIAIDAGHGGENPGARGDRKSRRLNSSHVKISSALPALRSFYTTLFRSPCHPTSSTATAWWWISMTRGPRPRRPRPAPAPRRCRRCARRLRRAPSGTISSPSTPAMAARTPELW